MIQSEQPDVRNRKPGYFELKGKVNSVQLLWVVEVDGMLVPMLCPGHLDMAKSFMEKGTDVVALVGTDDQHCINIIDPKKPSEWKPEYASKRD